MSPGMLPKFRTGGPGVTHTSGSNAGTTAFPTSPEELSKVKTTQFKASRRYLEGSCVGQSSFAGKKADPSTFQQNLLGSMWQFLPS